MFVLLNTNEKYVFLRNGDRQIGNEYDVCVLSIYRAVTNHLAEYKIDTNYRSIHFLGPSIHMVKEAVCCVLERRLPLPLIREHET